jgi:DsbC/DsbD-like thiol-disulfide interchange protein
MNFYRRFLQIFGRAAGVSIATLTVFSTAHAATSEWASNEGGRMRLVALAPDADGHVRAALQIEPRAGWVTYWREPGESGIPPQITLAPDRKAVLERIAYPVPKPISLGDIREIGYDAPVSLPLDFRANGDTQLDITAFIGVCKNICIPFQANLSVGLPAAGSAEGTDAAIIAAANGSLPAAPSADFAVQSHSLSADGKTLSLRLTVPEGGGAIPQVYVTGPSGYVFFKQAGASRNGRDVATTITIGKLPKSYTVKGKSWGILVVDGQRAMETTLAMQ